MLEAEIEILVLLGRGWQISTVSSAQSLVLVKICSDTGPGVQM